MSIHHSKGLQFPVVFLAGLTKRKIPTHRPFSLIKNTVWVLKSMTRAPEKSSTLMFEAVKSAKAKSESSELFENLLCCGHPRHRQSFYNCLRKRTRKAPLKTPRQRLVRTTAGKTVPSTRLSWRTRPPFRLLSTAARCFIPTETTSLGAWREFFSRRRRKPDNGQSSSFFRRGKKR